MARSLHPLNPPNLVQAEFILVDLRSSPEAFQAEIEERIADQAHIKETFRFYDEDGRITSLVEKFDTHERKGRQFHQRFKESQSHFGRRVLSIRNGFNLRRKLVAKARAVDAVRQTVVAILEARGGIVIERANRSFRLLEQNEYHDMQERVAHSSGAQLFVARPNDLLADRIDIFTRVR